MRYELSNKKFVTEYETDECHYITASQSHKVFPDREQATSFERRVGSGRIASYF